MEVVTEAELIKHGSKMKTEAPDRSSARADLLVHLPETGKSFIMDLTVLQPKPIFEGPGGRSEIEDAEEAKFHRYPRNFHIDPSEIIPLVYSCVRGMVQRDGGLSEDDVQEGSERERGALQQALHALPLSRGDDHRQMDGAHVACNQRAEPGSGGTRGII